MKRVLTILFFVCALSASAQKKVEEKEKKEVVFVVPAGDYNNFRQGLLEWKRLIVYDPTMKAEDCVALIKNLDNYMLLLESRVKRDSVITNSKTK